MAVTQRVLDNGKKVQINISGRFDYEISQAFRDAYRHLPNVNGVQFYINLSQAVYMDSLHWGCYYYYVSMQKAITERSLLNSQVNRLTRFLKSQTLSSYFQ